MKSSAKKYWFGVSLLLLLSIYLTIPTPANAYHQIGYSCENSCIVVVDPVTRYPTIMDCCGGFVKAQRIRHDRIFAIFN